MTQSSPRQTLLADQVAVVTGGSSGLGLGFARTLGRAGAQVVIGALPGSGVIEAVEQLRSEGLRAEGVELDVGDLAGVEALRDRALSLGGLDLWVNNAGASGVYGPTHLTPPAVFERVVTANIRGVFHGTRTAAAAMLAQGHGRIVNVWGRGATKPVPLQNAYASSKAWNRSFTRAVLAELKGTGVHIHGYDPGLVRTDLLSRPTITPGQEGRVKALPYVAGLWGRSPDDAAAPILDLIAGGRGDYRDLTLPTVIGRGLRSVAAGNLRASRRMKLDITVLPIEDPEAR